jgi:hypothetical protein
MASIMFLDTTGENQGTPIVLRPINIAYFRKVCHNFMRRWTDTTRVRHRVSDALLRIPDHLQGVNGPTRRITHDEKHPQPQYYDLLPNLDPCSFYSLYVDAIHKLRIFFPRISLHQSASLFVPIAIGVSPQIIHRIYSLWIDRRKLPKGSLLCASLLKECSKTCYKDTPGWNEQDSRFSMQQHHEVSVRDMIATTINFIAIRNMYHNPDEVENNMERSINNLIEKVNKAPSKVYHTPTRKEYQFTASTLGLSPTACFSPDSLTSPILSTVPKP